VRLLSAADGATDASRKRLFLGIFGSLLAGAALALGVVVGLEMFDRRVRGLEDLEGHAPVLGVLEPPWAKRDLLGRLLSSDAPGRRRLLPMPASRP